MQLIPYDKNGRLLLDRALSRYGFAPEHNADWFEHYSEKIEQKYLFTGPDGSLVMVRHIGNEWFNFSEPVAERNSAPSIILKFISHILKNYPSDKVWLEISEPLRNHLLEELPEQYKMNPINYTLIWPVMDMTKFDTTLPTSHFKSIRNAKNKFYRENEVNIIKTADVDKEGLMEIVRVWKLRRTHHDRAFCEHYINLINSGFKGTTTARAMLVNGKVAGFNAGWEIPNSDSFYAAVGLHDYSVQDLGLMLYLEDLEWIKAAGYVTADMGGVEKGGELNFKDQFLPEKWYKTFVFSVINR